MKKPADGVTCRSFAAMVACCMFTGPPAVGQDTASPVQPPDKELEELETVVVYGGYATPKMWKVSKDDRVLWILGDTPAPPGAAWRFDTVEARLAESQLVMFPGSTGPDIGFFKGVRMLALLPAAYQASTKIPGNKTMKDVLPPEVYQRWRMLRTEYAPRDGGLDRSIPSIALSKLEDAIGEKLGEKKKKPANAEPQPARYGPTLGPLVAKSAKTHHVKVRTLPDVEWEFDVKTIRVVLKALEKGDLKVDSKCVDQHLEYLERKAAYLKKDAAEKAREKAPTRAPPCAERILMEGEVDGEGNAASGVAKMVEKTQLQEKLAGEKLDAQWLAASQEALAKNHSTIAVLQRSQLRSLASQIARLRDLGYQVEEPGVVAE
jgi:hypothetical protein